jgi:hypothetical protein
MRSGFVVLGLGLAGCAPAASGLAPPTPVTVQGSGDASAASVYVVFA